MRRVTIIPLLLSLAAFAQEPAPEQTPPPREEAEQPPKRPFRMGAIIVTASPLGPVPQFDVPYKADSLGVEEIQLRRQSRTLPEALKDVPGVTVQKTGHGQGSPFIRGFTGYRNLLMLDGIRLNSGIQRQGPNQYWATVDSFLIDRIEVLRGPASILYGSDSLGGTVVVYTPRLEDFEPGVHGHERTVLRYSSGEDAFVARQELIGNVNDFAASVGGTFRDYGDIRGGRHVGTQPETSYDQWDGERSILRATSGGSLGSIGHPR